MKEIFNICIDSAVLASFRQQVKQRDRSSTIESMMRAFLITNEPSRDEAEIMSRLDEINHEMEERRQEQANLAVQLAKINNSREETRRKNIEGSLMMRNTNRSRGLADEIGADHA